MKRTTHLVIGADSFVGSSLVASLRERGHQVWATTRRADTLGNQRIFFDFAGEDDFALPTGVTHVHVLAGATNYTLCANNPQAMYVNTVRTPQLVQSFLRQGLFVSFVSSNTVFGGDMPWPHEDAPHDARFPYAIQKHEAEVRMVEAARADGLAHCLAIVRLTKVLGETTPPVPQWMDSWRRGEVVRPFADLIFAPMSLGFVSNSLCTLAESGVSGSLHLSGKDNVNYVDFARALAVELGVSPDLVESSSACAQGVHIPYMPRYSGLGMERTSELTGVQPQPLQDVVRDLVAHLRF